MSTEPAQCLLETRRGGCSHFVYTLREESLEVFILSAAYLICLRPHQCPLPSILAPLIQCPYRFECPLVAATIQRGLHHPEFGSWVYIPLAKAEEAHDWADKTVYYLPDPIDPDSFLQSTIEKHDIPYILPDGSEQYLRVYLTRPNSMVNAYLLTLHASHSVIDARPGLNTLSLLLEWMTTPGLADIDELAWGTEHKNLPPGPITITGGPREDWNTNGTTLVERFLAASGDETVRAQPT